jgi:hypothetical protein
MQNIKFLASYIESNMLQFADSYIHDANLKAFVKTQAKHNTKLVVATIDASIKFSKDVHNITARE